jgi:hypothetical protein
MLEWSAPSLEFRNTLSILENRRRTAVSRASMNDSATNSLTNTHSQRSSTRVALSRNGGSITTRTDRIPHSMAWRRTSSSSNIQISLTHGYPWPRNRGSVTDSSAIDRDTKKSPYSVTVSSARSSVAVASTAARASRFNAGTKSQDSPYFQLRRSTT